MADFRIGRHLVSSPSILDDGDIVYHYSLIEVFYDYDSDNPRYDEIMEGINPRLTDEERQEIYDTLPVKIINYCDSNLLKHFDILTDLQEVVQDMQKAFELPYINLDFFPNEIPAGDTIVKPAQAKGVMLPINPFMIDTINKYMDAKAKKLKARELKKLKPEKKKAVKKTKKAKPEKVNPDPDKKAIRQPKKKKPAVRKLKSNGKNK